MLIRSSGEGLPERAQVANMPAGQVLNFAHAPGPRAARADRNRKVSPTSVARKSPTPRADHWHVTNPPSLRLAATANNASIAGMAASAPASNVGEQPPQSLPAPQNGDSEVDASRGESVTQPEEDEAQRALDEAAAEESREKLRREKEARAQALTLEIVGDLPFAEVKPPENILFVCKLNPVTEGTHYNILAFRLKQSY